MGTGPERVVEGGEEDEEGDDGMEVGWKVIRGSDLEGDGENGYSLGCGQVSGKGGT